LRAFTCDNCGQLLFFENSLCLRCSTPLTYALNAVNRSMGRDDLYPFTLAPGVIEKLSFVHERVLAGAAVAGVRG
jgi:hypothetical protein